MMKGISIHFNPIMALKILAFSCSVLHLHTDILAFFLSIVTIVHDISSLNSVTVTLNGRNFYYHPVNKTTEVKSTDISNTAAFCSEICKHIRRQKL